MCFLCTCSTRRTSAPAFCVWVYLFHKCVCVEHTHTAHLQARVSQSTLAWPFVLLIEQVHLRLVTVGVLVLLVGQVHLHTQRKCTCSTSRTSSLVLLVEQVLLFY